MHLQEKQLETIIDMFGRQIYNYYQLPLLPRDTYLTNLYLLPEEYASLKESVSGWKRKTRKELGQSEMNILFFQDELDFDQHSFPALIHSLLVTNEPSEAAILPYIFYLTGVRTLLNNSGKDLEKSELLMRTDNFLKHEYARLTAKKTPSFAGPDATLVAPGTFQQENYLNRFTEFWKNSVRDMQKGRILSPLIYNAAVLDRLEMTYSNFSSDIYSPNKHIAAPPISKVTPQEIPIIIKPLIYDGLRLLVKMFDGFGLNIKNQQAILSNSWVKGPLEPQVTIAYEKFALLLENLTKPAKAKRRSGWRPVRNQMVYIDNLVKQTGEQNQKQVDYFAQAMRAEKLLKVKDLGTTTIQELDIFAKYVSREIPSLREYVENITHLQEQFIAVEGMGYQQTLNDQGRYALDDTLYTLGQKLINMTTEVIEFYTLAITKSKNQVPRSKFNQDAFSISKPLKKFKVLFSDLPQSDYFRTMFDRFVKEKWKPFVRTPEKVNSILPETTVILPLKQKYGNGN